MVGGEELQGRSLGLVLRAVVKGVRFWLQIGRFSDGFWSMGRVAGVLRVLFEKGFTFLREEGRNTYRFHVHSAT